jgi:hypothetical protein
MSACQLKVLLMAASLMTSASRFDLRGCNNKRRSDAHTLRSKQKPIGQHALLLCTSSIIILFMLERFEG